MSAFFGMLRTDGVVVDPQFLEQIAERLRFRGPDGSQTWTKDGLGACFTYLETGTRHQSRCQPVRLGERYALLGEVRLDARKQLIGELLKEQQPATSETSDQELLLLAWNAWGEGALDRLLGDFSCAIWDALQQSLYCARDFAGARPFFYAWREGIFSFGNTLNVLRSVPGISDALDELFVRDFLLTGLCSDPTRTIWRDIQRLPAGHRLVLSRGQIQVRRFLSGLQSAPLQHGDIGLWFEDGPEPDWARSLLALPARILSQRSEPPGSLDPSFVLTEHGEAAGFELSYSDGTRFVVDGAAAQVWGTYQPPLTAEDLATYFLGPVLGFVLRRRNIACLHASGVELHGHAVCFCGDAGFGKSTTAAALALRGLPVVAEDIVAMEETGGEFRAVPGYPRVCLWPESVRMLLGRQDALPQLTPVWEKRYLELDGQRAKFTEAKLPLGLLYLFGPRSDHDAPRIEKLSAREALLELVQNTYMNWVLNREQRANEFDILCRLVRRVPVRRIVPHAKPEKIASLCEMILRDAGATLSSKAIP
jgi:hypothetical protein